MSYGEKYNAAYDCQTAAPAYAPPPCADAQCVARDSLVGVLDRGRTNEDRLREMLGRVVSLADELLGQHPAEANCGTPEPMPMGVVGALEASTVSVGRLISQVYSQLDRIHVAIGG